MGDVPTQPRCRPLRGTNMLAPGTIASNERLVAEERARLALERRLGRSVSEREWASYRSRLVAFFQLLRSWEKTSSS